MAARTYSIVRFFERESVRPQTLKRGLSLDEAEEYCSDPETSSSTCTTTTAKECTAMNGQWFDGYQEEE